jgi:Zn-dependent protease/CBS domain-containing protein
MGAGFRVGTIFGIPIRIDYSWLIIFGIISFSLTAQFFPLNVPHQSLPVYLLLGLVTTLLFFGSVLAHELMHSVVAKSKGMGVSAITLFVFGGVSQLEEEPATPRVEFEMAVVGPLTSLVLGAVFFVIWAAARIAGNLWLRAAAQELSFINFALGLFNLLPGFPLDGGRVLRSLLWHASGDLRQATRIAAGSGQVIGYLMMAFGVLLFFTHEGLLSGIWLAFIGWFLLGASQQANQQMIFRTALAGVSAGALARRDVMALPPDLSVQSLVDDYLLRHAANVFPVVSDGRILGTVGLNEIHQVPRDQWPATPVSRIMRPITPGEVVSDQLDAWDAVQRLGHTDCECLLLVDGDKLDGIVTRDSLLRWVHTQLRPQA